MLLENRVFVENSIFKELKSTILPTTKKVAENFENEVCKVAVR